MRIPAGTRILSSKRYHICEDGIKYGVRVNFRFGLASSRRIAIKEMVFACIAGAVLCMANYRVEDIVGDDFNRSLISSAFIFICWGIVLFKNYYDCLYLFRES